MLQEVLGVGSGAVGALVMEGLTHQTIRQEQCQVEPNVINVYLWRLPHLGIRQCPAMLSLVSWGRNHY